MRAYYSIHARELQTGDGNLFHAQVLSVNNSNEVLANIDLEVLNDLDKFEIINSHFEWVDEKKAAAIQVVIMMGDEPLSFDNGLEGNSYTLQDELPVAYELTREFGGTEEGGWYYDCYSSPQLMDETTAESIERQDAKRGGGYQPRVVILREVIVGQNETKQRPIYC